MYNITSHSCLSVNFHEVRAVAERNDGLLAQSCLASLSMDGHEVLKTMVSWSQTITDCHFKERTDQRFSKSLSSSAVNSNHFR